jgi:hypothetical protein
MTPEGASLLKRMIETQHGGVATFHHSVRIIKQATRADWDGIVHVFDLARHSSKRAYAWCMSVEGRGTLRYFAVLHGGKVSDPIEAVKAAAMAIRSANPATRPNEPREESPQHGLWA